MVHWKSLSIWSLAVNLDNLVASIPFPANQVETVKVETFLEQSRFSNSQCEKVIHRVFVRGPCFKSAESNKEVRPGSIEAFATLLSIAIANIKRSTPSLSRFAPHHGRLFRPLSPIVTSVTTI
jgi:hypothetical protein